VKPRRHGLGEQSVEGGGAPWIVVLQPGDGGDIEASKLGRRGGSSGCRPGCATHDTEVTDQVTGPGEPEDSIGVDVVGTDPETDLAVIN
jgi:hypothetical protein